MSLESRLGTRILQGVVAFQRPAILVLMVIAALAFVFLGFYAIVKFGYPVLTGGIEMNENATLLIRIGLALLICVPPFLPAWLSWHYAKKARRQIPMKAHRRGLDLRESKR